MDGDLILKTYLSQRYDILSLFPEGRVVRGRLQCCCDGPMWTAGGEGDNPLVTWVATIVTRTGSHPHNTERRDAAALYIQHSQS